MNQLLKKLFKGLAYTMAAIVILLGIAVGIFRLMLPRLPEYQEEIKDWASTAIGMHVEFAGMNARWRLSGPELSFFDARLNHAETGDSILTAEEVSVGVGLLRLIADRELVVDRVSIRDTAIDLRKDESGQWLLQGFPLDGLIGSREMSAASGDVAVIGQNIDVQFEHPTSGQVVPFTIRSVSVNRNENETGLVADIDLPDSFGNRLDVSANQLNTDGVEDVWRLYIEGDALDLGGWSRLQPIGMPELVSGTADLNVWLDLSEGAVESATADVVVSNLAVVGPNSLAPLGVRGSFEYSSESGGWLLAANQFRLTTIDGAWPQSNLQLQIINDEAGELSQVRTSATYFDLDDLRYLSSWLPEEHKTRLAQLALSGVLRDVNVELASLESEKPEFDVSAELQSVGIAANSERPGVREFSGRVRAGRDGGRVEIESTDFRLDLGSSLPDPLTFDDAFGTVIWRRNQNGVTILSDSVRIRNTDFDSQMSLQVSIPANDDAPFVDFESTWSVYDVSVMHRYLPVRFITPKLRQWLTDALVSGQISRGTTSFNGAVDEFPFDGGGGEFRIEAKLENATLLYSDQWPAPRFRHVDIVVENARLYSFENSATNLGNIVEDARIEIPDLRQPVLSIDAFATGTLESIHSYAMQSPIHNVLGGQLDKVQVSGDASFDLSITYPIQDKENYDFSTRIRASDGMIRVAGFDAPITELNGIVQVTRKDVSSESLFGHFLGRPVDLSLSRIADEQAPHSVILDAIGMATSDALQAELGLPLGGLLTGDMQYSASLRFPNGIALKPGSLQVMVESDLLGMVAELPVPLGKTADEPLPTSLNIEFPSGNRILASGSLAGNMNWTLRFLKDDDVWDFDRGVLALGGEFPREPEVRGLHIHGAMPELDVHSWLTEARRGERKSGIGERIRSIDLSVHHLYAIGQRYLDHRIVVDRSGQDWLVQINGDEAQGVITVPYDFDAGRPMTLIMDRLVLPGDDTSEPSQNEYVDPRTLPAISVSVAEFMLGDRVFGTLEAEFERTNRGLEAANMLTTDKSFTIEGASGWIVDSLQSSGQRTFIDVKLQSSDVLETSKRLAYESGIAADELTVDVGFQWDGGPRRDFMSVLNGNLSVSLGSGRLTEVSPGAGRVFGLMSIVELPRRLALDFRDVFDSGFSFDRITGNFQLVDGDAFTCDLTLSGPAADVGIVGRAGFVTRDYDQAALVSANVGNTLPVVGWVAGGPQVAAALLLFSQIFKKPLKDVSQVFYTIEGSWDEPLIDSADSQRFAEISGVAGCLES